MLRDAVNFIELLSNQVTFASCLAIFLGGGYIALHSRVMPKWAVTGLWYIGLAALLNAITILVEWVEGQLHPLSHFQLGAATDTVFMLSIAAMVGMLFFHTIWKDYQGSRNRHQTPNSNIKSAGKKLKTKIGTTRRKVVSKITKPAPKNNPLEL